MPPRLQVYLLDPRTLDPETIAVTFAKTSRSPESFAEIAAELSAESSSRFHEKWVVGYGHASVAEHAVLHIAVENISRLAVEVLESNRLASYTEKSTRYQQWGADHFVVPPESEGQPWQSAYLQTCQRLFEVYQESLTQLKPVAASSHPRQPSEDESAWQRRIRTTYVDVARFLLPASSMANVGITINARALEHAICKCLSHPLQEVRQVGAALQKTALEQTPTLLKYAGEVPYLVHTPDRLKKIAASLVDPGGSDWCELVAWDPQTEDRLLAAALYRYGCSGFNVALEQVSHFSPAEKRQLALDLLADVGKHDLPLRELEHAQFTFDLILDQGAYFELKRHRMMSQSPQPLTTRLGYSLPCWFSQAGMEETYRIAMQQAEETFETIARHNPEAAAYIVPNAFNRRLLLSANLRSLFHMLRLRTAPNAHFSMRRVASRMASEIIRCAPLLGGILFSDLQVDWREVESSHFTQV